MKSTSRRAALAAILLLAAAWASAQAGSTIVDFDTPAPEGPGDSNLDGVFGGIDFGTAQWNWSGPYNVNPTNSLYFSSSAATSRTFRFEAGPQVLESVRVYATAEGQLMLSDDQGQQVSRSVPTGQLFVVPTGWPLAGTTVTVAFSSGWSLGLDDITYRAGGPPPPDAMAPTVALTAPSGVAALRGTVGVAAAASDDQGVVGVSFFVDGLALGPEDPVAPYAVSWDTTAAADGPHTLTAVARDAAGNTGVSTAVEVEVDNGAPTGGGYALRFYGNGVDAPDLDRVKIRVDDPANSLPGPPVDIGNEDLTIEFWMRAEPGANAAPAVNCGANNDWIYGNIIVDRDRYNQPRSFGVSLGAGELVFSVTGEQGSSNDVTLCSNTNVADGAWHHVAVQRRRSDGYLWIYIDGLRVAEGDGPDGDVSYPDGGVPGDYCGGQSCAFSDPFIVIGAEKHDAGPAYPSYSGWFDELRISNVLRYAGASVPRPSQPFVPDAFTAGLYHFDNGAGDLIVDVSGAPGGPSHGERRFGGSPAGPEWILSDAPLTAGVPDTQPPTTPSGLQATAVSASRVDLSWSSSTDDVAVVGYRVFRDGGLQAVVPGTSYADGAVAPAASYSYEVLAFDPSGNVSALSTPALATTPEGSPAGWTLVDFDNPEPLGGEGALDGVFGGIDFGMGQWNWEGPYGPDLSNNIYFNNGQGTSRAFSFADGARTLEGVRVFATSAGDMTLSDDRGQFLTRTIAPGAMQAVVLGWSLPSTTVTVSFTRGWSLGVDDISYR